MKESKIAKQMADDILKAYLENDRKNQEASAFYFTKVFQNLFPMISKERIKKAAHAYAVALKHSQVEDRGDTVSARLDHARWRSVKNSLLEMCYALGLPEDYAAEETEFLRHHLIGSSQFVTHILNADRLFTNSITGTDAFSSILGGLKLACVGCYDLHTENGILLGKELMRIYFTILLITTYDDSLGIRPTSN